MVFQLDPALAPAREIARVADEVLAEARRIMGDLAGDVAKRIHIARTASKKVRALIRIPSGWPQAAVKREDERLRRAARRLSRFRDAEALRNACRALAPVRSSDRAALAVLRREVLHHREAVLADAARVEAALLRAARDYGRVQSALKRWPGGDGGPDSVVPAFQRSYRRARRRLRSLDGKATGAAYHRWRKAVKRFGYHCRLLRDVGPAFARPYSAAVDQLGDRLGSEHDLALLSEFVRRHADPRMLGLIDRRRRKFRREAARLGRSVFAEKPKAYARRLRERWRVAVGG
jgi:CHAD domain-containing protein